MKKALVFSPSGYTIGPGNCHEDHTTLHRPGQPSYFEDCEVAFESKGLLGLFSEPMGAKAVFFREIPPGYVYPWHTVVCREYVVTLDG